MQMPVQITFRHMASSPAIEERIRERVDALERFFDRIVACRVIVERREPRQQGNVYQIRIDLSVPGREIVIGRDTKAQHAHQDVHAAIRDTFDAARRQLEDHARGRRGEVKVHSVPDHGRITRFLPEKDCGFIASADGSEIYFHRNSVVGGAFDKLQVGDEVRFVAQETESIKGPQASSVVPLGKHHLPPTETTRP
jgi:ribosomal subunit interface protein